MILENIIDFRPKAYKYSMQFVKGKNKRADARPMTNHSATV